MDREGLIQARDDVSKVIDRHRTDTNWRPVESGLAFSMLKTELDKGEAKNKQGCRH
jgi:hypothetical protein